jgi:predicted metal-dependent phosphotriesterase family hydrolase
MVSVLGEVVRTESEQGVELKRVAIDHVNDTTDLKYLTWPLDQGCCLGMDLCPGLSHGMAIHFGRIAGLNAASQK